jgi:TetR/AcrR family transcriptional regulator, regulator of cefoperazone and chloramphenicol sensitivity
MPDTGESIDQTSDRLLQAAEAEFAIDGFRKTTVQAICKRAEANIAAVNYHFGSKENLYRAVVDRARLALEADFPLPVDSGDAAAELREFIGTMLGRLLSTGRHAWIARLWAMELVDPSPVMDVVVAMIVSPAHRRLRGIVSALTGRSDDDPVVWRLTASVVGQCLFYHIARPVISRLGRTVPSEAPDIQRLADGIARFSLAGILAERIQPT